MYAKIKDKELVVFPYTFENLQRDNPFTKFNTVDLIDAFTGTEDNLAGFSLVGVIENKRPMYNQTTQFVVLKDKPNLVEDVWILDWDIKDKNEYQINEVLVNLTASVRNQRNQLLLESDWTQVLDSPVDRIEWAKYRQELRDITKQSGFPNDIIWPSLPSKIEISYV